MGSAVIIGEDLKVLYIGPDHRWAHEVLATALNQGLEAAPTYAAAMHRGRDSYDLVFLDISQTPDKTWRQTLTVLWQHGLKTIIVSPEPDWREVRIAMFCGASYYIEKTYSVEELAREITNVEKIGVSGRR